MPVLSIFHSAACVEQFVGRALAFKAIRSSSFSQALLPLVCLLFPFALSMPRFFVIARAGQDDALLSNHDKNLNLRSLFLL